MMLRFSADWSVTPVQRPGKQPWIIWFRSWKQRGLNMNGIIMSL